MAIELKTVLKTIDGISSTINEKLKLSGVILTMFDKRNNLTAINPGAAGKHGFHKKRTMIRFKISSQGIKDMQIIDLGERGKLSDSIR